MGERKRGRKAERMKMEDKVGKKKREDFRGKSRERGRTYLITTLVNVQFIASTSCWVWLPHPQHDHVFPVRVLVVSDVGDTLQGVAREHTLLLVVRHLDAIFGEREDLYVTCAGHPGHSTMTLS